MRSLRADTSGLSQIVAPSGRILAQAPLTTSTALIGDVPLGTGAGTPFTRLGDWIVYLCLLVVGGQVCQALLDRKRAKNPSADAASPVPCTSGDAIEIAPTV